MIFVSIIASLSLSPSALSNRETGTAMYYDFWHLLIFILVVDNIIIQTLMFYFFTSGKKIVPTL